MNPSSLAGHAIELLDLIVKSNVSADKIIADFYRQRRYLGSHDRRWISEKVYSIIRNFIFLRELSKKCSGFWEGRDAMAAFITHEIKLAGMGVDQLKTGYSQLLDTYKLSGGEVKLENVVACIDEAAARLASDPSNLSVMNSFPDFFCELLAPGVKQDCVSIMTALNHEAQVCIRVDTTKISRERVIDDFQSHGVAGTLSQFSPFGVYLSKRINLNMVDLYKNGLVEVQDEASQLVGLVVDPREGETIVDACAGAGGKSLELAMLSNSRSKIFAFDVDEIRLKNLRIRAARNRYENISAVKISNEDFANAESLLGLADKVVVDAPCTGSGTIRRNPERKFRLNKDSVAKAAAYQRKLLKGYSQLVKKTGLLVYVTCSIFEEENQAVVENFIAQEHAFQKVDISARLSDPKFAGMMEDGFLAIYPHRYEMDGFFVAVMERVT